MNLRLLLVFLIAITTYVIQAQSSVEPPTISLSPDNNVVFMQDDAWGAEMMMPLGNPIHPAAIEGILFSIADPDSPSNWLYVSVTSSNQLTLPGQNVNITITGDNSTVGSTATLSIQLTPQQPGNTTVNIIVEDESGNRTSYHIALNVKTCEDVLCIDSDDLCILPANIVHQFNVNQIIKTSSVIKPNQYIRLFAGNSVEMLPGFDAPLGMNFLADIQPCPF